jgi:hypothetical protein
MEAAGMAGADTMATTHMAAAVKAKENGTAGHALMHVSQCPLERHNIFWVGDIPPSLCLTNPMGLLLLLLYL